MKELTLIHAGPSIGIQTLVKYYVKYKPNNLYSVVPHYMGTIFITTPSSRNRNRAVMIKNGRKSFTADFSRSGDYVLVFDGESYIVMERKHYQKLTNREPIVLIGS